VHSLKALLFFLLTLSSQALLAEHALTPVTLQLKWNHQFQFAGYYAAIQQGYYQQVGLDVTIKEGIHPPYDEVESNQVDFGISGSGLIVEQAKKNAFVALAAINQVNQYVWIIKADSDIYTAKDFIGKTVTHQSGDDALTAMFTKEGIALKHINISSPKYTVDDLISGNIDALSGYKSNEPFLLQQQGIDFRIISPEKYGIDFYGDVLFTSKRMLQSNPDTVKSFREASLKGWRYALEHHDEIIELIKEKYNSQNKSRQHLQFEAKAISKSTLHPIIEIGHMNEGRWKHIIKTYHDAGVVSANFNLDGFVYTSSEISDDKLYWVLFIALISIFIITVIALHFARVSRELDRLIYLKNQYANIGESVSNITHQWKQPLNELGIQLMLLESEINKAPASIDSNKTKILSKKSHQILQFMADTVDLFRFFLNSDSKVALFNPTEVIESTIQLLSDSLRLNRIEISQDLTSTKMIHGNSTEFAHIILSILVNARDVLLERNITSPRINIHLSSDDNFIKLSITDNAGGIQAQPINSIFELGFSEKVSGKSGVGLYIAKNIIEKQMNGKIRVNNSYLGACFTLLIPSDSTH